MFVAHANTAPTRHLDGLTSRALLQEGDVADADLTVTWVDVEPGSAQQTHAHDPQQIYVIVAGHGRMTVGPTGTTLWDLDDAHWRDHACTLAGRNLTRAEWSRYLSSVGAYR